MATFQKFLGEHMHLTLHTSPINPPEEYYPSMNVMQIYLSNYSRQEIHSLLCKVPPPVSTTPPAMDYWYIYTYEVEKFPTTESKIP